MSDRGLIRFEQINGAAILAVAATLVIPAIVSPPMTHDSFWIDWVWSAQVTQELARGHFLPRWLPESHDGLGSPVFYYYPPLAFYLTGMFGLIGLGTYPAILAAFFASSAASGWAMYAWLKGSARPLLGALLFMAAPYHLFDFYSRGARAEHLAIALLPLVAIGLRRATQGRILLCAAAYAALLLTHLPLSLLVSVFFVTPYAALLSRGKPKRLLRLVVPLLLGLGVAAFYLVPALWLEPYRDAAKLWQLATFKPENWSILAWSVEGPSREMRSAVAAILLVLAYTSLVIIFAGARLWGGYALACCVVAAGLIPGLWTLPLLESVQFPFRLLPLAEFAIATGAAHLALPRLLIAASLPMLALSALFLFVQPRDAEVTREQIIADRPDVPENLPPGERPYSWPSKWALNAARVHRAPRITNGVTVEPVFYFPAWEVRCGGRVVPTFPEPGTQLLAYRGSDCERRLVTTAPERIGAAVSLAGLLALFGLALGGWLRSRRRGTAVPADVDDADLVRIDT